MNPFPYKDVFLAVEKRLIEAGSTQMDKAKIQDHLDKETLNKAGHTAIATLQFEFQCFGYEISLI